MDMNAKPAPIAEIQSLVSGMSDEEPLYGDDAPERPVSLSEYFKTQQAAVAGTGPRPMFAEEVNPSLIAATSDDTLAKSQFSDLAGKPPAERAKIGARFGARAGLQSTGLVGSFVGAGVGALAGRALGIIQTGEHEDNTRKDKMLETLSTMGVTNKDNMIDFEDLGVSPLLTNNPSMRLANMSAYGDGADRSIYEIDKSNPFSTRAQTVARPIALFMSQGLLGYRDRKNPQDQKSAQNALGMFVNSIADGADSEALVYGRARKLVDKFGLNEDSMRTYFDANKGMFSAEEAASIRQGLDTLFTGRGK